MLTERLRAPRLSPDPGGPSVKADGPPVRQGPWAADAITFPCPRNH